MRTEHEVRGRRAAAARGRLQATAAAAVWAALLCGGLSGPAAGQAPPDGSPPDPQRANLRLADLPLAPPGPTQPTRDAADLDAVKARCAAARQRLAAEQYDQALAELDAALELHGGSYETLLLLAQTLAAVGRCGEARLAAEHALAYRPGGADALYFLGRLHRSRGRPEAALGPLRAAAQAAGEADNPRAVAAWHELGECLAETGYLLAAAEALAAFDEAVWSAPPEVRQAPEVAAILKLHPYGALERRLALLERIGRAEDGAQAAQAAAERHPDEPYYSRVYVRTLLGVGQAERALAFCRARLAALTATSTAPAAGDRVGAALLGLAIEAARAAGRVDRWVADLEAELAAAGDSPPAQAVDLVARLAGRLDEAGERAAAAALWRAVCRARPASVEAAWALAGAEQRAGNLAAALEALIALARSNPERADIPPDALAGWTRRSAATEELLRLIEARTRAADADFATYTVLGVAAGAAGQAELAERLLGTALEQRPDLALPHVAWGRLLLADHRWEEARRHAEAALAAAPGLAAAQFLLAEAHAGLDEEDAAEAAYKAALEREPGHIGYLLGLARFCHRTGRLLAAQRYYQEAWELDRTRAEAVEELVDCYLEGGKIEIARGVLREAEACDLPEDALRRMRTTLRFAEAPLREEHVAELRQQFAEHPEDARTGLKLAAGLYLRRNVAEAYETLGRVRACAPDDERALHLLARVQLARLEWESAIALLEQLAARYPRRAALRELLVEAQLADFRLDDARATLRGLLAGQIDPAARLRYRELWLGTHVELAEFDAALQLIDEWIAAEPEEDAWPRMKQQVLILAGRGPEAVALAEARLEAAGRAFEESVDRFDDLAARSRQNPDDAALQAELKSLEGVLNARLAAAQLCRQEYQQVCRDAGQPEAALPRVRAWVAEQPEQAAYREWLVELLLAAGQPAEALEAAAGFTPRTTREALAVYDWRARACAAAGQLDRAVGELDDLLAEGFVRADEAARRAVRQRLVQLLIEAEDFDRALARCDAWLGDLPPGDAATRADVLNLKRFVLQAAGRDDELIAVAEQLLALTPHDPGLNNDLGYTWVDRGENVERALEMIRLAVAAEPHNAAYLDSLGWAHYKRGEFHAALRHLARSVRLRTGQDPVVYDHLGDAACRLGDRAAAREHWRRALDLLEQPGRADVPARRTALLAALRGKLAALERAEEPGLAPTAAEQRAVEEEGGPR